MGVIRTVCGDIAPEELGFTSVHDHTIFQPSMLTKIMLKSMPDMMKGATGYRGGADLGEEAARREKERITDIPQMDIKGVLGSMKLPGNNPARKLTDEDYYINELRAYRECGGKSLCDCSPLPSGAKLSVIRELSERTGVQIISCAGYYTKAAIEMLAKKEVKQGEAAMQEKVERYLSQGDGSCDARPGFVKCAVSVLEKEEICPEEMMAVRACARAAKNFGMSLHIHNQFPVRRVHILKLADMLEQEIGIYPGKVVFCHMDSYNLGMGNPAARINAEGYDIELPLELAGRGFNVGLDTWSISAANREVMDYNINTRKKMLLELIAHGMVSHVTLGHDFMGKANGVQNGGFGYTLFPNILEEMAEKGELTQETCRALTVENPARILAI